MQSFARVLMGLSHPLQVVGRARAVTQSYDWPHPPQIERDWFAVVSADDAVTLAWRVRTVREALEGVGLRCVDAPNAPTTIPAFAPAEVQRDCVADWPDLAATLILRRWPREVAPGWLGQALASDLPVDAAVHIVPRDPQQFARKLKLQQTRQAGSDDAGDMLGHRDARRIREELIARKDRPVGVSIVLTVRAPTRELLEQRVQTVKHECGLALADVREATFEHDRGLEATSLTGRCDLIGAQRTLNCMAVASTWPFQPATVNHRHGAPLGTTHQGSMLVKLDPFDLSLESFGGIICGKVGAGKSFFLKLLVRRLKNVEVLIVEQRSPAEYDGIPGAQSYNLADVPMGERADHLREFVSALWRTAKADPKPRLLVLDELWSLLRDPALAALIEEIARIGRHHFLSLFIATQQVRELLESGRAVLDNAAIRVYLKQHDRDLDDLCEAVGLPAPARRFLRGAARGQALLDVGGLLVPVDVQASPSEHVAITTDPRERVLDNPPAARNDASDGVGNLANGRADPAGVHADSEAGVLAVRGPAAGLAGALALE